MQTLQPSSLCRHAVSGLGDPVTLWQPAYVQAAARSCTTLRLRTKLVIMQGISLTMMSMLPGTAILCSLTCVCVVAIQHARQLSINEHSKPGGAVPERGQRDHVPLGVLQHNLSQRYGLICVVPDKLPHLQDTYARC